MYGGVESGWRCVCQSGDDEGGRATRAGLAASSAGQRASTCERTRTWRALGQALLQLRHRAAQRLRVLLRDDDGQLQGRRRAQLHAPTSTHAYAGTGTGTSTQMVSRRKGEGVRAQGSRCGQASHGECASVLPCCPASHTPHHAPAGVDDRREASDDGAEALLHVAHQQRGRRRIELANTAAAAAAASSHGRHGAHCTIRDSGISLGVGGVCVGGGGWRDRNGRWRPESRKLSPI